MPSEQAVESLRALGALAVPAVLARLDGSRSPDRWLWAKLLADIGIASAEVSDALERAMTNRHLGEPDRAWAAAALSGAPLDAEQHEHYTARLRHLRQDDPDPSVRNAAAALGG
ncbi:hypothetical protein [Streptomyces sp. NPDC087538]|uniref:hypothetical protein n=1 Tax=Streptomyces sp. NPDC087538 TaxID=3365797 RepID=UPI00382C787B